MELHFKDRHSAEIFNQNMNADFKKTEAAITYTSGYATNISVISTLLGRGDYVICDKLNHASIVDGCLMSGAKFLRFRHNDMRARCTPHTLLVSKARINNGSLSRPTEVFEESTQSPRL